MIKYFCPLPTLLMVLSLALIFPLLLLAGCGTGKASLIPDTSTEANTAAEEEQTTLVSETTAELDQLLIADFTPDITLLGDVVTPLLVKTRGALFHETTSPTSL